MRKLTVLILAIILLLNLNLGAFAASDEAGTVIYFQETNTEDGIVIIDKILLSPQFARSNTETATRTKSFYREGALIAEIKFAATFRYDGSSVSVISKAVTQTDTYSGWNYIQQSFTSSGGTVTLEGKLRKLLVLNVPFTMGLTCDVNGNITPI